MQQKEDPSHSIRTLNNLDNVAANTANGMQVAGEYAALASHLGQYGTMLRDAGNSLTKGVLTNNHLAQ